MEISPTSHVISLERTHIQQANMNEEMPLVDFFFDLHSGKLFGFFGQSEFAFCNFILDLVVAWKEVLVLGYVTHFVPFYLHL